MTTEHIEEFNRLGLEEKIERVKANPEICALLLINQSKLIELMMKQLETKDKIINLQKSLIEVLKNERKFFKKIRR